MDEHRRRLERLAAQGDPLAAQKLINLRWRLQEFPWQQPQILGLLHFAFENLIRGGLGYDKFVDRGDGNFRRGFSAETPEEAIIDDDSFFRVLLLRPYILINGLEGFIEYAFSQNEVIAYKWQSPLWSTRIDDASLRISAMQRGGDFLLIGTPAVETWVVDDDFKPIMVV